MSLQSLFRSKKAGMICLVMLMNSFSNDLSFYKSAGEHLRQEISLGRLAEKNGSPRTKTIGRVTADELTVAYNDLQPIASKHNYLLPALTDPGYNKEVEELKDLQGKTFDESYKKSQKRNLKHLIEIFKQESESGEDQVARTYAGRYLPKLQMQLQLFTSDSMAIKISVDSTPNK